MTCQRCQFWKRNYRYHGTCWREPNGAPVQEDFSCEAFQPKVIHVTKAQPAKEDGKQA